LDSEKYLDIEQALEDMINIVSENDDTMKILNKKKTKIQNYQ